MFKFGDWVVYDNGYKQDLGRVAKVSDDGTDCWMCYTHGCTAARTETCDLVAFDDKVHTFPLDKNIGYHRFDKTCPDRDDEYCFMCSAVRSDNVKSESSY